MGTRCVITFIDDFYGDKRFFSVYKHWEGNVVNIIALLHNAKQYAWPLPRYEADEFACAFIVAAKEGPGDVRMTDCADSHGDLSFSYYVSMKDKKLFLTAYDSRGEIVYNDFVDNFKP